MYDPLGDNTIYGQKLKLTVLLDGNSGGPRVKLRGVHNCLNSTL